mgnify:CR=1 FL=1
MSIDDPTPTSVKVPGTATATLVSSDKILDAGWADWCNLPCSP